MLVKSDLTSEDTTLWSSYIGTVLIASLNVSVDCSLPVGSFCGSPTYQLSKHLTSILKPLSDESRHKVQSIDIFNDAIKTLPLSTNPHRTRDLARRLLLTKGQVYFFLWFYVQFHRNLESQNVLSPAQNGKTLGHGDCKN